MNVDMYTHESMHIRSHFAHLIYYYTAKHFMYPEDRDMSVRDALNLIQPNHIAFGSGASSLLSHLAQSLAEEGDAVLIPAPYYAGKSAFVLFYIMNSCVHYKLLVIWLLHLNFVCLYLITFTSHIY